MNQSPIKMTLTGKRFRFRKILSFRVCDSLSLATSIAVIFNVPSEYHQPRQEIHVRLELCQRPLPIILRLDSNTESHLSHAG